MTEDNSQPLDLSTFSRNSAEKPRRLGKGLGALMGGAAATHLRRGEPAVTPIVLGLLAVAAGVLRWRRGKAAG